MDSEEETAKPRSLEGGENGGQTSHDMLCSDEIRPDSYSEIVSEGLGKIPSAIVGHDVCASRSLFESLVEAAGSSPVAAEHMRDGSITVETEISSNSSQSPPSGTPEVDSQSPGPQRGSGMRKWRRIRRDLKKEGSSSADSAQVLKRRFNNTEPSKNHQESKMKSKAEAEGEDSVPSVESKNTEIDHLVVDTGTLDAQLELVASTGFSIGMESDNSEDHSSKSSTAASAPRLKLDALRTGRDRGKVKNLSGKGSTRLGPQKVHLGRSGTVDYSKNIREDLSRFEKENSLSSVESDLRSSAVGIVKWGSMINSNGKSKGRSLKLDEHNDEAHTGEEVQSGFYKENRKAENLSRDDSDGKLLEENNQNSEICQSSSDLDPFKKSMIFLQEAQEILEKEIEKIDAIGKEKVEKDKLFERSESTSSSRTLESHLFDLKKKVENLEAKLEEASTTLKAKEQKLSQLETLLCHNHSPHEEQINSELENLLTIKMEAEIEYLILTKTTKNFKILSDDQIALFHEQKHLAADQEQMILKLRDAEEKTVRLSEQTRSLEECCRELAGMEAVLRLQSTACKFSLCFAAQLVLLFVALGLFLVRLLGPASGVVPT